jgi:hypothetical protein
MDSSGCNEQFNPDDESDKKEFVPITVNLSSIPMFATETEKNKFKTLLHRIRNEITPLELPPSKVSPRIKDSVIVPDKPKRSEPSVFIFNTQMAASERSYVNDDSDIPEVLILMSDSDSLYQVDDETTKSVLKSLLSQNSTSTSTKGYMKLKVSTFNLILHSASSAPPEAEKREASIEADNKKSIVISRNMTESTDDDDDDDDNSLVNSTLSNCRDDSVDSMPCPSFHNSVRSKSDPIFAPKNVIPNNPSHCCRI